MLRVRWCRLQAAAGIAFLEAALLSMLLLSLLGGGVVFVHYLSQSSVVQQAVDRHVYDSGVKPFRFSISAGGNVSPVFQESEVRSHVVAVQHRIVNQLLEEIDVEARSEAALRIDVAFATVPIDVQTGVAQLGQLSVTELPARGSFQPPPELDHSLDLESAFRSQAAVTLASGTSVMAIPRGSAGETVVRERYLPLAVLIGARAILSLEGTGAARLLEVVGVEPTLGATKVAWLRGDMGR